MIGSPRALSLIALLALTGCGETPEPPPEPTPPAEPEPADEAVDPIGAALAGDEPAGAAAVAAAEEALEAPPEPRDTPLSVWMEVEIEVPRDGRPLISGRTNLPEGALLVITLETDDGVVSAPAVAAVAGGAYSAGPLGPEEGLGSGEFLARVAAATAGSQPTAVAADFGAGGALLVGERVSQGGLGLKVERVEPFQVEAGVGRMLYGEEARDEARALLEGLRAVETLGRSMQPLRVSFDPNDRPRCQGKEGDGQEQLRALDRRNQRLPTALRSPLQAVVNDLKHCVQCEGSAMDMCAVADSSLDRAATQVASASYADLTPVQ